MIQAVGIVKTYQKKRILDNLNLSCDKGSTTWLTGLSGAGKTTLLGIIAGLISPDSGQVFQFGEIVNSKAGCKKPALREMGYIFQSAGLWPHMNVVEQVGYSLHKLSKTERESRVTNLLEALGISALHKRYPHEISGGEARRVSMARMLAPNPKLLLMDEPFANVDDETRMSISSFLSDWQKENSVTIIAVTHRMEDIKGLPGTVYQMVNGQLVEKGPVND